VAIVENGVDVLELGLPYSDPVMDGPVIQAATLQALDNGFRIADGFEAVRRITDRVEAPVLIMTYWNPVVQYGVDRFADDLAAAGGAGLITPDLIPDEAADWIAASERTGLDRVFLAAPTSSDARLELAVESSRGFVYTVSTMGITGARSDVDVAARTLVARLAEAGSPASCCRTRHLDRGAGRRGARVRRRCDRRLRARESPRRGRRRRRRRARGRAGARYAPRVKYADSGLQGQKSHEERQEAE
jgi:tryptophan synthase alpha subunit